MSSSPFFTSGDEMYKRLFTSSCHENTLKLMQQERLSFALNWEHFGTFVCFLMFLTYIRFHMRKISYDLLCFHLSRVNYNSWSVALLPPTFWSHMCLQTWFRLIIRNIRCWLTLYFNMMSSEWEAVQNSSAKDTVSSIMSFGCYFGSCILACWWSVQCPEAETL